MAAAYRPIEAVALLRPTLRLPRVQSSARHPAANPLRPSFSTTQHARAAPSTSPPPIPPRKSITLASDTGRVRWSDLSPGEKVVRTTQQSANLAVVIVGVLATGAVGYFLFADVFSPSSKTAFFNRATTLIRSDARCTALLGPGPQIAAFGENSWSRWARNRYISSTEETDAWGTEHMRFRFFVEGPRGQGVVHVHLVKKPSWEAFEFETLALDVKGQRRIEVLAEEKREKATPKFFGARWW